MSKNFREWKRFIKLKHTRGRYIEYKPTLYYYKKMIREQQRALKKANKSWRRFWQELRKENG